MSTHRPISIFALQTEEERARTERLVEALEECGPNEVRLAHERVGLPEPHAGAPLASPDVRAEVRQANEWGKLADWARRNKQVAACLLIAAVLAVGIPFGYSVGWSNASDDAERIAAEQAAAEAAAQPIDLAQREANVNTHYKNLKIDVSSADRVSADKIEPLTVDKAKPKPTTELKRIADVDVSKGTKVKLDVPLVNQMDDSNGGTAMANGCEMASLAMLLQHAGVMATKEKLASEIPIVPLVGKDGRHGNPNKAFVGEMGGEPAGQAGYSVYHGPVAVLAQRHLLNRSFKVVDITGQEFTVLLKELASGNPVWVITTTTMQPDMLEEVWETPDGTMRVNWMLHSVVVTGFDDKHVFINDPYGYDTNVPYDRKGFEAAWKLMGSQAVVIVPTE